VGFDITAKACLSESTLSTRGVPTDHGLRRYFFVGRAVGVKRGIIGKSANSTGLTVFSTQTLPSKVNTMSMTFTKKEPPEWLLAFWKEIDDKTFGKGFDCFAKDAIGNLGVADWHGREAIRENLRAFIDTGFTAHHDVLEYWDGGLLKIFHGIVTMTPDDSSKPIVKPVMSHFFYMDEKDPTKVRRWVGAVGPVQF
jgi:hypothetical protein